MPNIIKTHRTKIALLVGVAILLAILVIVMIQANRPVSENPQSTTTFAPTTTIAPDNTTIPTTETTTASTTTESIATVPPTEEATELTTAPTETHSAETEPAVTTFPTTVPAPTAPPATNPPPTEPPATTPIQTEPSQGNSTETDTSPNGSAAADNSTDTESANPTTGNIGNYVGPANPYTGLSWDGVSPIIYTYPDGTTGTEPMEGATYESKPGVISTYVIYRDGSGRPHGSVCESCGRIVWIIGKTDEETCYHYDISCWCSYCGVWREAFTCHFHENYVEGVFYCEYCGKVCGDGSNGTCVRWSFVPGEHTCTCCGATVPEYTCHTCETN